MKKKSIRNHSIDTVFVLIIFSAFAFCVLMVLSLGAGVYKNINDITREHENERTVLSYVRTKVRNLDNAGAVKIAAYGSTDALEIFETIGEREFKTVIYCHDGWLYEMFTNASMDFSLEEGLRVSQVSDLQFTELAGGSIKVSSGDLSLIIALRSGISGSNGISSHESGVSG